MSRITQIRDVAASSKGNLSDALLQCLVLADELEYPPLSDWGNLELSGYSDEESLPEYRKVRSSLIGTLIEAHSYTKDYTVPDLWIDEEYRERALTVSVFDGIPKLLSLPDDGSMGVSGPFINYVQGRINNRLQKKHGRYVGVRSLALSVPPVTYAGVIGAVQQRIVRFMIELNRMYPSDEQIQMESGEHRRQIDQAFVVSIGNVQNLVLGSSVGQVNQKSELAIAVHEHDFESLAAYLRSLEIPKDAIAELESIATEIAEGNQSEEVERSLKDWIGEQVSEIPEAAGEIATEGTKRALTTAIFEGIKRYAPEALDWLQNIDVSIDMWPM